MLYLSCVKSLADDLGITSAFDSGTMGRLDKGKESQDSLGASYGTHLYHPVKLRRPAQASTTSFPLRYAATCRPISGVSRTSASSVTRTFALASVALAALAYAAAAWLLASGFGRTLVGIRANEGRMRAFGLAVWRHKANAFGLSGALAGLAWWVVRSESLPAARLPSLLAGIAVIWLCGSIARELGVLDRPGVRLIVPSPADDAEGLLPITQARVHITGTIYPGVRIIIGPAELSIEEERRGGTFYYDSASGQVVGLYRGEK